MSESLSLLLLSCLLSAAPSPNEMAAGFREVPPDYSPVPIWWWGGDPIEREGIRDQLERMAEGGIYNVVVMNPPPSGAPRAGVADAPPFLSEAWWDLFACALEEAKTRGIRLWFYDPLGSPSAGLQARVMHGHPEFRGVRLERSVRDLTGPATVRIETPPTGEALAAFVARRLQGKEWPDRPAFPVDTMEDAPQGPRPSAPSGKSRRRGKKARRGQKTPPRPLLGRIGKGARKAPPWLGTPIEGVDNVSGEIADGLIEVEVPEGPHRVQLFYLLPGDFDYQNPEAGAALLDVVHGEMARRFQDDLGKGVAGSFQDACPAMPKFSRRLPAAFRERMGYDLIEHLPALYDNVADRFGAPNGPDTVQIRCAANDVAAALCEEAFFVPRHQWHERYGMLCGFNQTVGDADPVRGEGHYIDYFKTMRHYGAPGQDVDGGAKPHQAIADLYGRPRVWMGAFHSSGWGQSLEEIATLLHPWIQQGSTLYSPHAISYSAHGSYWEWAPPDTGWRQPYFVHHKPFADYVARLCYVLSQGRHEVEAAVLHPAATIHAYTGFNNSNPTADEASQRYWQVQRALEDKHVDYIIIDEDTIGRAAVEGGALAIEGLRLRFIALPGCHVLRGTTVDKLQQMAQNGGSVVSVGNHVSHAGDRRMPAGKFAGKLAKLRQDVPSVAQPGKAADIAFACLARPVREPVDVLQRKIGDRDFYFVLTYGQLRAESGARFSVNGHDLWNTPWGRGEGIELTFNRDGVPELWNAYTGEVAPLYPYVRDPDQGTTRVWLPLDTTAAPLIALRPPAPEDPIAVDVDFDVATVEATSKGPRCVGYPRLTGGDEPTPGITRIPIDGPLACRLEATCDNRDGSFAWPPSADFLPVETRAFRFREEPKGGATAEWTAPNYDDSKWDTAIASFGPRARWTGPLDVTPEEYEDHPETLETPAPWRPAVYSPRLGINEDGLFSSDLGGKGRIPESFIDLGSVEAGKLYLLRALVYAPEDGPSLPCVLRVGAQATRRAFVNRTEVAFSEPGAPRIVYGNTTLQAGANELLLILWPAEAGPLRIFYHFLPPDETPQHPEWIWSHAPSPTGRSRFFTKLHLPNEVQHAEMLVALGDLHQIRVNLALVADQDSFDPYFTSRAERYDITPHLHAGDNRVEIVARDLGPAIGLLLDGLVICADGEEVPFMSGPDFKTVPEGRGMGAPRPARVIPGPEHGYIGDPAALQLRPRPHPLPLAGWLQGQPAPAAPYDRLAYAADDVIPPAAWFRFLLPPGATALSFETPGKAMLYVNGAKTALSAEGRCLSATLSNPDAPKRVAALRIASVRGYAQGAALLAPITYEMGDGRIPFGSWDELGLPHYAGGLVYIADVELEALEDRKATLDLGRVRGTAEVRVNGQDCGIRLWHPYRFDIGHAAKPGKNHIEIRVFNTLGPHYAEGHPSRHVFKNQTQSGIFGPVSICLLDRIERTLPTSP